MIKNPKNGWCFFSIGAFKGTPSYLTDVPIDLLNAFIQYNQTGTGIAWFDEEGSDFTLVLNPDSIFIIEEKEQPVLHYFPDLEVGTLKKELIKDIESDLNGWAEFIPSDNKHEIYEHKNEILQKLTILKAL